MQNKTFRLFISSPFSDFEKEREVLHKEVFPKVEEYCKQKNLTFQPIDLRWGVNEEAQLDQKTLEVCLEEVRACKHFPHPNFLILAGDRYGYVPLPYMIEKDEYEKILKVSNAEDINILNNWYKVDENKIYRCSDGITSTAYILQIRSGEYKDYPTWEKQEILLRDILQKAANTVFTDKEDKEYQKYFLSATEQEVIEGICKFKEKTTSQKECDDEIDKKYVFGYLRDIEGASGKYIDKDETLQIKAKNFKSNLQTTLDEENIQSIHFSSEEYYEENSLKKFKEYITKKLINSIDEQEKATQEISKLEQEILEQEKFLEDKVKCFQGRETTLTLIDNYLKTATTKALIVHGASGMGKSSLMAKAIKCTKVNNKIFRFVGATANSTTINNLLISIIDELYSNNIIEHREVYELDNNKFEIQIKKILLSIKTDIVIFIDALDQLQHMNYLNWLSDELPVNVKIILSVLNDNKYKEDTHYYKLLSSRCNNEKLFIDITNDSLEKNKDKLIETLLEVENRKLDEYQTNYLLEKWKKAKYSPLYLKIAIEEVKHWKSSDKSQKLNDGVEGIILEYLGNLISHFHHEKVLIKKVFGYIHSSKEGLSEQELLQILSEDLEDDKEFRDVIINQYHKPIKVTNQRRDSKEEYVLPIAIWSRLHTLIKQFIVKKNINKQHLIKFFHRQFSSVIDSFIENNKKILHIKLANYFLTLQDKTKTWDEKYNNLHMLDELPYQLFHSNKSIQLKEILFDLEFTSTIYNNYKQDTFKNILNKSSQLDGINEGEVHRWHSFYRENEHLIKFKNDKEWKASQSLAQLAYEDGNNSPVSNKADKLDKSNELWLKNNHRKKVYKKSGLIRELSGHSESIKGVTILDNNYILSYASDNILRLWDDNGLEKKICKGHKDYIIGAIELENQNILSYSADNCLMIWSFKDNDREIKPTYILNNHTDVVNGAVIVNKNILSYSDDGSIVLWDYKGNIIQKIFAHDKQIKGILKSDDNSIISYSDDLSIKRWTYGYDLNNNIFIDDKPIVFKGHNLRIRDVIQLNNGNILSYGYDRKILVWNHDGKLFKTLIGHEDMIWGVIELNNNKIYSFADDMRTCIWDLNNNNSEIKPDIKKIHNRYIWGAIQLENQPDKIISFSDDRTLKLFDAKKDETIEFKGHARTVKGVIEIDKYIISFSVDNTIRLWDKNGKELRCYDGHNAEIIGIVKINNNKFLSYSIDKTLRIWDIDENDFNIINQGHTNKITGLKKYKIDNLLTYSDDCTLRLWDKMGQEQVIFKGHNNYIFNVLVLKNDSLLSYSADNTIRLWSRNGEEYRKIDILENKDLVQENISSRKTYNFGRDEYILNVIESKDTNKIYGCTYDDKFFIYDIEHNKKEIKFTQASSYDKKYYAVNSNQLYKNNKKIGEINDAIFGIKELRNGNILTFSKTGKRKIFNLNNNTEQEFKSGSSEAIRDTIELENGNLLTYASSSGMEIRDYKNLKKVIVGMEKHTDAIWGAKVQKIDGIEKIISYSFDNTKRIWSNTGKEEKILELDREPASGILELTNANVVFYLLNNTIHIYDSKTNKIKYIGGHKDFINGVTELDNENIITYSDDHKICIWNINKHKLEKYWQLNSEVIGSKKLNNNNIIFYSNSGELSILINNNLIVNQNAHKKSINGVIELTNNNILSYSNDGSVKIWDITNINDVLYTLKEEYMYGVIKVVINENKLYAYSEDKTIKIWTIKNNMYNYLETIYIAKNQVNFNELVDNNLIVVDGRELLSYKFVK